MSQKQSHNKSLGFRRNKQNRLRNGSVGSRNISAENTGENVIKDYIKPEPIDEAKVEAFRRIVSAEDIEEIDSFYNTSTDEGYDGMPDSGACDLSHMDPEQREKLQEEWKLELAKTEEEIQTLRQVLSSKVRHAQELKRKLGITVWKEFQQDLGQGVKNIQESTAYKAASLKLLDWNKATRSTQLYQKTADVVKIAGEKTTSVFGSLGGSVARKLGEVKNSNAFKSFEERVTSTVSTVKTRMTGSRSNSTNSFEDALNSTERRNSQTATPATTPTIPEEKPIS